jgi:hypothetical protein
MADVIFPQQNFINKGKIINILDQNNLTSTAKFQTFG